MKAKLAIVGCGNPAQKWHLPTPHILAKHGELDFVALCDMNEPFEVAENYFRMPKQRMIIKLIKEGILGDIVRVYFIEPKRQDPFEPTVTHKGLGRPISGFGRTSGMCLDMGAHLLS